MGNQLSRLGWHRHKLCGDYLRKSNTVRRVPYQRYAEPEHEHMGLVVDRLLRREGLRSLPYMRAVFVMIYKQSLYSRAINNCNEKP